MIKDRNQNPGVEGNRLVKILSIPCSAMGFYPTYGKIALGVSFNAKGKVVADPMSKEEGGAKIILCASCFEI